MLNSIFLLKQNSDAMIQITVLCHIVCGVVYFTVYLVLMVLCLVFEPGSYVE